MRVLFIGLFFLLNGVLFAQEPSYWRLTDKEGLPSMTVYNIQQDSKGFMWIGTAAGLCRYDGKEFKYYRHPEQVDDEILYLKIDQYDRVWYSNLAQQLCFVDSDENVKLVKAPTEKKVSRLLNFFLIDSLIFYSYHDYDKGRKYKLRYTNISRSKIKPFEEWSNTGETLKGITSIEKTAKDTISILTVQYKANYFLTSIQLSSLNEDVLESILNSGESNSELHIPSLFDKKMVSMLSVADSKCFISFQELTFKNFITGTIDSIKFQHHVNHTSKMDNEVWALVNSEGIIVVNTKGEKKETYFKKKNLNSLLEDAEGNIWVASNNNGIFIFPTKYLKFYDATNSKLESNQITFLAADTFNHQVLLEGAQSRIYHMNDSDLKKKYALKDFLQITSGVQIDKNHWLFCNSTSLIESKSGKVNRLNIKNSAFKTLSIDRQKNIWTGTHVNCSKIPSDIMFKKDGIKFKESDYSVLNQRTYAILNDFEEKTWIGTSRGLYQYNSSENEPIQVTNEGNQLLYRFTAIVQSPIDSTIWAATNGNGLLKIKDDKIQAVFTTSDSLVSNICNALFADHFGNIWIATNRGLQKHNIQSGTFELMNKYDGFPTDEIAKVVVLDSTVYVGTNQGLITFPINLKTKNSISPPIYLSNISIGGRDTLIQENYNLTYEQNSLKIDFVGIGYKSQGDIQYKYRMTGLDSNWIETDARFARFPGLSPGDYQFEVYALNEDGIESKLPATVNFTITPPFWQTWWFQILTLLGLISISGAIANYRNQVIRKREQREQAFKDQFAELRSEALQSQMNPHFIFNSLSAIQHFFTKNDQENAMIYLARFAKLIRSIFEQSKEKLISIDQELDFLKLYISLEELRFKDKVTIHLKIDENLQFQADQIRIPPLLIQPIIENAFKHGLFHKEKPGNLWIDFSYKNDVLKCVIEDDGIGRTRSQEINTWKAGQHKSSGLSSTTERIRLLNRESSEAEDSNILKIIDLYTPSGVPSGTRVELFLKPAFL